MQYPRLDVIFRGYVVDIADLVDSEGFGKRGEEWPARHSRLGLLPHHMSHLVGTGRIAAPC